MKKYSFLFNKQTLFVAGCSLISSYVSLRFQLSIYLDYLILSLIVVFPLTLTIRLAFRRRERALLAFSGLKASVMSLFYSVENRKLEPEKKAEFKNILINLSDTLAQYLAGEKGTALDVQRSCEKIVRYVRANNESLKRPFSLKISFYLQRVNEDLEFLLATKRHNTPKGIRAIILFAIYTFVIFYPASLLKDTGFDMPLWYVFMMTSFKGIMLIALYNVQVLLEDPFNQNSPDGIRINDFKFSGWIDAPIELEAKAPKKDKKDKKNKPGEVEEDDDDEQDGTI